MMDSRSHRLAALSLAAVAMACARSRTNEVGISDSATATTAVSSDSTVATTTRTDTTRSDSTMRRDTTTTTTDTTVRRDTSMTRTDTTRSSASGDVSLGTGSASDAMVARLISTIDRGEIETARLVLSKTQNNDVRTFAQQLIDEHTASLAMVDSTANSNNASTTRTDSTMTTDTTRRDSTTTSSQTQTGTQDVGAAITKLQSDHTRAMESLRGMSGTDFDKAFAQHQVDDHQNALTLLRQFGSNVNSPTLKSHVTMYTTKVSEHLEKARTLQRTITSE
jgi:putative membrane protein